MNKLRISIAATLVCMGAILISASLLFAKSKAEVAADRCDVIFASCMTRVSNYLPQNQKAAEQACNDWYRQCLKDAGLPLHPAPSPGRTLASGQNMPGKITPTPSPPLKKTNQPIHRETPTPTPGKHKGA